MSYTHIGFTDESFHNIGRFRGLGCVTLEERNRDRLEKTLKTLLVESNVNEFKWSKLKDARYRFAALKMTSFCLEEVCKGALRVDVLMWDIEDARHKIFRRNDMANLARMYYHLFKFVLRDCWPDDCSWRLCPDENTGIEWSDLEKFLNLANTGMELIEENNLYRRSATVVFREYFRVEQILPCKSHENVMVQLADLFVGLAIYSRANYGLYKQYALLNDKQLSMFDSEASAAEKTTIGGTDSERLKVLDDLNTRCKQNKLGVSLKTYEGLRSMNSSRRLNFWWYEPQHPDDRAPIKI